MSDINHPQRGNPQRTPNHGARSTALTGPEGAALPNALPPDSAAKPGGAGPSHKSSTCALGKTPGEVGDYGEGVSEAIRSTVPTCRRRWRNAVEQFAIRLRAVPCLSDMGEEQAVRFAEAWRLAAGRPMVNVAPAEVAAALREAWVKAYPAERGPLEFLLPLAKAFRDGRLQVGFQRREYVTLAGLCRLLGEQGPFFLSWRTAGELLGVHETTAGDYLRRLCRDGWIRLLRRGDRARGRASEYLWRGRPE